MRALVGLAALLLGISLAGTAAAQSSDGEKEAAKILFTEGKELRDAGKLLAALDRFKRAYELAATPITTLEYARTHAMLGHLVEARRLYRSIGAMEVKPGESAKATAAREEAAQLAKALDARIPTLVLRIESEEPLVAASLDGRALELGKLSEPLAVDPGKHVVSARASAEVSTTIEVAEGEHDRVVTLVVPKKGTVAPPPPPPPPPIEPAPSSTWTTVRWTSVVVGGFALLAGAGAGIVALSGASKLKDACTSGTCPPSQHDQLDATHRWATVSNIGFGVAAASAAIFVITLVGEPKKTEVVGSSVVPYASLSSIGITGRF